MYSLCLGSCISRRSECLGGGHADAPQALVYIYIYMYVYIYTYLPIYIHTNMHTYLHIYIYIYTSACGASACPPPRHAERRDMHEPRHKEYIGAAGLRPAPPPAFGRWGSLTWTGLRPVVRRLRRRNLHRRAFGPSFVVNGPTARDFVAFGDEIFAPSTQVDGLRPVDRHLRRRTGLRPVVRSIFSTIKERQALLLNITPFRRNCFYYSLLVPSNNDTSLLVRGQAR